MFHSELDFRPVQIITGDVIYKSLYKYWLGENGLSFTNWKYGGKYNGK